MSQKVKIGLVGVANHGKTILTAINAAENLELFACFDINNDANAQCASEHGCTAYDSYEALLANPDVEAVALVTPNHLHAAQIEAALNAGKHVFVDKPITNTIEEGKLVLEQSRKESKILYVGHNTRKRRVFRHSKSLLDAGAIGTVVAIEANLSRSVGLTDEMPAWKADRKNAPILPMTQLGIHFVDVATYLLGPVSRVSCFARTAALDGTAYDTTTAILELANGVPVSLNSYYVTPDTYFYRIYGTTGVIECGLSEVRIRRTDGKVELHELGIEGLESYELQMEEFGTCIVNGTRPETGGEEGLHNLAVIEAMIRSIDSGNSIYIDDILN
jgi:predicted dehydrogenase